MRLKLLNSLFYNIIFFSSFGCVNQETRPIFDIIPHPLELETVNEFSDIDTVVFKNDNDLSHYKLWIQDWSKVVENDEVENNVVLNSIAGISKSGYILSVEKRQINIKYSDKEGLRNSLSSLYQLLKLNNGKIPIVSINDKVGFSYRGMHLDVARHMFSVDEVKAYIDYLVFYKYNKFHWHLTEDQGWRIEIKKYPKLQSIAAYRNETLIGHYNDTPHQFDGKKYGGFYTQEEIKDVVKYASQRGIEVIPEIDIPGHSLALLSAYPELGCEEKHYEAATKWGVFTDVLCPKEETFTFLQNVFDEIIKLFPSKYIHIGGDECPKDVWKKSRLCQDLIKQHQLGDENGLQSYFIKRIESYLNSKGRQIIGWDEILEGGLAPNATVMSWRGVQGGIEAAEEGHDVIMTPTSHCYFDYYQSNRPEEPLAIGGYLPVKKVYQWNPIPEQLQIEKHKHILGGQGNVWTEYIPNFNKLEYMALARLIVLSEVLWGKNSLTYDKFSAHMYSHIKYWKREGANIANHLFDPTVTASVSAKSGVGLNATNLPSGTSSRVKGPNDHEYSMFENPYPIKVAGTYYIKSSFEGIESEPRKVTFSPHLGNKSSITLKNQPANKYSGSGNDCLINGIEGSNEKYGGSEWLGFSGKDLDAILTFENDIEIKSVEVKFFNGEGQWIYLPQSLSVYHINEKGEQTLIKYQEVTKTDQKTIKVKLDFMPISVSTLRIHAKNFGNIPEGRQGSGHKAWLFVDEIIIK